jgi:hypothetical protein
LKRTPSSSVAMSKAMLRGLSDEQVWTMLNLLWEESYRRVQVKLREPEKAASSRQRRGAE